MSSAIPGRRGRRSSDVRYVVDTDVLSAGAPAKAAQPALTDWMRAHADRLFLSAVTIAEIEAGIAKARRKGAAAKADRIGNWLDLTLHLYARKILPLDLAVARVLGRLTDAASARGEAPGYADLAIAATAQVHGCTILTRNVRHFRPIGVPYHDPYESLPDAS